MKKTGFIESVRVTDPCTQAWDEMIGNDKVRFCTHCAKDVNNLSAMTRKEALKLVRKSGGSLCIRYVQQPVTKAPMFSEQLTQITRRAPLMAAGVMTASLSLSALTYAQGGSIPRGNSPAASRVTACDDVAKDAKDAKEGDASLVRGKALDPNGALIPNLPVSLIDESGHAIQKMSTDTDGEFRFENVKPGSYSLRTDRVAGFAETIKNVTVAEETAADITVTVDVAGISVVVGGAIAVEAEFESALAVAVSNDAVDDARDLLVRGADVNHKEAGGTALFIAVENGNLEMVELLLNFGAKVNSRNQQKETALMKLDEDASLEMVQLLIRYGAKVNQVAKNGDTALIRAAREVEPEILKALIEAGADLNAQNEEGTTALINAADNDNLENVRVLVLAGADVNLKDKEGETAWDHTAEEAIEELLVSHGAIVEDDDPDEPDAEPDND